MPTRYRKSLIYQAAPDIASELAACGLVGREEHCDHRNTSSSNYRDSSGGAELLKISIKAVNLGNASDEKLETHVSKNFLLGTRLKFGSKMKNGFRSSKQIRTRNKSIAADEPH